MTDTVIRRKPQPVPKPFPGRHRLVVTCAKGILPYLKQEILFEGETVEVGMGFLELVRKKGYSMLHLLTEAEYQAGLRTLENALRNGQQYLKVPPVSSTM